MIFEKRLNNIVRIVYLVLALIPFPYIIGSTWSYYSMQNAKGYVHGYSDPFEFLAQNKNSVNILSFDYGKIFLGAFMVSLLIVPFYLLANYIASKYLVGIPFYRKLAIVLLSIYLISFLLIFRTKPFGGWYFQLMLD